MDALHQVAGMGQHQIIVTHAESLNADHDTYTCVLCIEKSRSVPDVQPARQVLGYRWVLKIDAK